MKVLVHLLSLMKKSGIFFKTGFMEQPSLDLIPSAGVSFSLRASPSVRRATAII